MPLHPTPLRVTGPALLKAEAPARPGRLPALLLPAMLALVTACSTPPHAPPSAAPAAARAFRHAPAATDADRRAAPLPDGAWWKVFADPVLDDLVERATRGNTDIEAAAARLAQARSLVLAAQADRRPQAGASLGASRQGGPLVNAAGGSGNLLTASASLSYEVDLFGRLAQAGDAAALDAQAREAQWHATRLLVQADVAQHYLTLRALDAEAGVLRDTVATQRETLRHTERRWQAGSVAELEVTRWRVAVAGASADLLVLEQRRVALEHALAVLVGEPASQFAVAAPAAVAALPEVPVGIPSEMLARRPDVRAAQHGVDAARLRGSQARAAWMPSLTLTASGGQAASNLAELLRASTRAWGIGALLAAPLLDGGRREAGIRSADAEADFAWSQYRGHVLTAFREVEDQLSLLQSLRAQAGQQALLAGAASRSVVLSESRYRSGLASQLDVLDAQRSELAGRRQMLQVQAAQYHATVGLIKALGGGWDAAARQP
jgi:outer membrane protein, multidrug efflux system